MYFSPLSCYPVPLRPKYSPQHSVLKDPQPMFLPECQRPSFTPIKKQYNIRIYNSVVNHRSTRIITCELLQSTDVSEMDGRDKGSSSFHSLQSHQSPLGMCPLGPMILSVCNAIKPVRFLNCTWQVPGSTLGQDHNHLNWSSGLYSPVHPRNAVRVIATEPLQRPSTSFLFVIR